MTSTNKPRQMSLSIQHHSEIDGIEMGILSDGTSFLSNKGLAKLCGVNPSVISEIGSSWGPGNKSPRDRAITRILDRIEYREDVLRFPLQQGGQSIQAYPEKVCMALLEYYTFESKPPRPEAALAYRTLAQAGLRTFVYQSIGYSPATPIPDIWRQYHDRVTLNMSPSGYFSVFTEIAHVIVGLIRGGLPVDEHTVPDVSVGLRWGKHWDASELDGQHGQRVKYPHAFPDYFRQAKSKEPIEAWVYPIDALPDFRRWLDEKYLPDFLPQYLKGKAKQLPPSAAALILKALTPAQLETGDGDDDD